MRVSRYRGRIAPSPTGLLHLGHARTFWTAFQRARDTGGALVFRNEDLDTARCRPEFVQAMFEDLGWLGIEWREGPDVGGPFAPYEQSQRRHLYVGAWSKLLERGWIYPCTCSRKDLEQAASAPHDDADEVPYPGTCRSKPFDASLWSGPCEARSEVTVPAVSWRFRVPDGECAPFDDALQEPQSFVAGRDFSDFVLWRRDDVSSYQLACVVDDDAMQITEVVRGADLLKSTARQLLLYRALGLRPPAWAHCDLLRDAAGQRLAKRHDASSLRALRSRGVSPQQIQQAFDDPQAMLDLQRRR
jgi:glutamyl-tRNA synthetase